MQTVLREYSSRLSYITARACFCASQVFLRRGYNVISLTVAETENPVYSRITIVSDVEPHKFFAG